MNLSSLQTCCWKSILQRCIISAVSTSFGEHTPSPSSLRADKTHKKIHYTCYTKYFRTQFLENLLKLTKGQPQKSCTSPRSHVTSPRSHHSVIDIISWSIEIACITATVNYYISQAIETVKYSFGVEWYWMVFSAREYSKSSLRLRTEVVHFCSLQSYYLWCHWVLGLRDPDEVQLLPPTTCSSQGG